jgi:hypothetical protein
MLAGLCLSVVALPLLAGCRDANAVENMSRSDQEKAFRGDKAKGDEMLAKMREKYSQPNSGQPNQTK